MPSETKNFSDTEVEDVAGDKIVEILEALASGPLGDAILGLARGTHRLVAKPLSPEVGFVVRAEPIPVLFADVQHRRAPAADSADTRIV